MERIARQDFSNKPPERRFLITSPTVPEAAALLGPKTQVPANPAPPANFLSCYYSPTSCSVDTCLPIFLTHSGQSSSHLSMFDLSVQLSAELIWSFSWPLAQPDMC